jgi:hypothetical protein
MMGSNDKPQNQLFYSFNLDEVVPEDHLLRHIDRFLDFSDLRQHLAAYYRRARVSGTARCRDADIEDATKARFTH